MRKSLLSHITSQSLAVCDSYGIVQGNGTSDTHHQIQHESAREAQVLALVMWSQVAAAVPAALQ